MGKPQRSILYLTLAFLTLASCSLLLVGCSRIEIMEQAPPSIIETPETDSSPPAEHDLAILAIDFHPPLDRRDLWTKQREVTLLIAVENRGLSQENDITVSAELSASHRSEMLLRQSAILETLAPGEVRVVRFGGIPTVPYRPAYRLEVTVLPVEGERILTDNSKVYELTVEEPTQSLGNGFTSPLPVP